MDEPPPDDLDLARQLYDRFLAGEAKSRIEIEVWGDATAHGRRFDRFIRTHLGISTTKPSKQSDLIGDLQQQVRALGGVPVGTTPSDWELQLSHARESCLAALRVWNDPTARFRTGAFSLLFVAAWNSLALAVLQRSGDEWRKLDESGSPQRVHGAVQAMDTHDLVRRAFGADNLAGVALRENVRFWIDLRNAVAHRHLPELDLTVIAHAQAGLMNIEGALDDHFGSEFTLAESLSVPLQLSGFRDPGILASRRALQAALPLDVQALLSRSDQLPPEVASDPAFQMRVAFLPVVPASGKGADAVAYFLKPGEVPTELEESLERYVVMPKVWKGGRWFRASEVAVEVQRRTGFKFVAAPHHANAAVKLGVRPPKGEPDRTIDITFAEYVSSFKQYQYTQAWIDRLVELCSSESGFEEVTDRPAVRITHAPESP